MRLNDDMKHIFNHSMDLMCIASTDGTFKRVSPSFTRILGFTEGELVAQPFLTWIHPDDLESTKKIVATLGQGIPLIDFENRYRCKNGEYRLISWVCEPDPRTGLLYATGRDITRQRASEKELENERLKSAHNAKLASLGEMSAGIAHEINNPLMVIHSGVQTLSRMKDDEGRFNERVDSIRKSTERIAKIVKSLRKFARNSEKTIHKRHQLGSIITEALTLTDAKARNHSTPVEVSIKGTCEILCDEIEIEQVLVNLISNGIDAVKEAPERWVKINAFENPDGIVVQVRDAGHGLSPEVRAKLFQPFYTTKAVGEGTGLGLSITKGILGDHRATIELLPNEPNTCFEIRFPKPEATVMAA